jgi:hypothetical protein
MTVPTLYPDISLGGAPIAVSVVTFGSRVIHTVYEASA